MKLVVDSNIFISSLDRLDIFHSECAPLFEKIIHRQIKVLSPLIVLAETVCILGRRLESKDLARRAYRDLAFQPAIHWLELKAAEAEEACELGIQTGLKGSDALVVQVAVKSGLPLLTKDKEIQAKAPASVQLIEPNDLRD